MESGISGRTRACGSCYDCSATHSEERIVKLHIALAGLAPLALACSSTPKIERQHAGEGGNAEALRERRATDLVDCATAMGALTQGLQSTASYSRAQAEDCMRARGWRKVAG